MQRGALGAACPCPLKAFHAISSQSIAVYFFVLWQKPRQALPIVPAPQPPDRLALLCPCL